MKFQSIQKIDFLDDLIYQEEESFKWTEEKISEVQLKLIKEAFEYHYEHCQGYRMYCKKMGIEPCDVNSIDDLCRIPLIPSTMFKLGDILSCDMNEVVKVCQSSGTQGSISKVYRDEKTLNRFLGSIQTSIDQVIEIDDAFCVNLGPSTKEAGDLWFSYAISVVDMIFPTEYFVVDGVFYPDKAYQKLNDMLDEYESLVLIGAPVMFYDLINYMEENKLSFSNSEKLYFITAGGWKRFEGKSIPRDEFIKLIQKYFIGAKTENFRDILNLVELNTIMPECECHIKHIVPWVKVIILDPVTLNPVSDGEIGLIAYLDPTTVSYPGFILTDDFGKIVINNNCQCGRSGIGLEIIRRVNKVESRGCALKIDKKYAKTN
ncbi:MULTISPECIES: hypothetical protein [Acetivibrio]|jgi:long-chain-fatty-acid---luciferin-component ligase|uniref:Long-chain-fatty-acid ligase n=1 Tax=Acetivibrio straminisolvens JCM 21531 TaxID=1294263 RepID=W4VCM2_9FIRM|nr:MULTISPECIES: hypothetical protein [Acetivibrio]NLM59298.1 hypothetical protein [Clostridium sp.]NLW26318.1 hypothetical protein [Acetivibrio saccincola]GAE90947.1 long-chain-fatty-acid ligase [Acetivibrio straminisolvens JCM 21531]HOA79474.1 hypothetical protein [Defluviitaleaceae bacterium]